MNTSVAGTYTVTYNVTTEDGNAAEEVVRVVNVEDTDLDAFIMEFTIGAGETLTIPLFNTAGHDFTIDWGDGSPLSTITTYNDADLAHTYTDAGNYQTRMSGTVKWIYFNGGYTYEIYDESYLKLIKIIQWGNVGFTNFKNAFFQCVNLSELPNGSITGAVDVLEFEQTFYSCTSLTTIPTDLFRYCINVSEYGFSSTFGYCTSLTTIPADLFRYNTLVSVGGFTCTFADCTSLTGIPDDLFRYNINVSLSGFYATFRNCISLTSIPADLFRYNINVSLNGFRATFESCTSLETVPDYLFRYNTLVYDAGFFVTFYNCPKLQLNPWMFYADGEQSTRFLNKTISFRVCFDRSTFTGTQGTAPDLWNCNFGTGTITKTDCFNGAGNSTTSLTNYGDIPTVWK